MLEDDLKFAFKVLSGNLTEFSRIYPFTNENIKGCFNHFDFDGKDVLSVLASSDQVFDIFLRGANKIDTFDINPLTKYYFYLKKAAVLALDKKTFLNFFNNTYDTHTLLYDKDIYLEISKYLSEEALLFWNKIFKSNDVEVKKLFLHNTIPIPTLSRNVLYLNEYDSLQHKIKNFDINFVACDLRYIDTILNNSYDIMYLSNILSRIDLIPQVNMESSLKKTIVKKLIIEINKLEKYLNSDGKILVNYFFDSLQGAIVENSLSSYKTFNTIYLDHNDSALLVYKK